MSKIQASTYIQYRLLRIQNTIIPYLYIFNSPHAISIVDQIGNKYFMYHGSMFTRRRLMLIYMFFVIASTAVFDVLKSWRLFRDYFCYSAVVTVDSVFGG